MIGFIVEVRHAHVSHARLCSHFPWCVMTYERDTELFGRRTSARACLSRERASR